MIPVLYAAEEKEYLTNGMGALSDAISCRVTEERNGLYELEMQYPVEGIHYGDIRHSMQIMADASDGITNQLFRIYKIKKPINGVVTINAKHVSYQLAHIPVKPFRAYTAAEALSGLKANAVENCPFEFWTDKPTVAQYKQTIPESIRMRLGGQEGSLLDVYGGEYEWDNYTVKLHTKRGSDKGVTLRYGKNITDIIQEENIANTYTGVMPYWMSEDKMVTLPEMVVYSDNADKFPYKRTKVIDFSTSFGEGVVPTEEQLRLKAQSYIRNNGIGVPSVSVKVSFVALWQTEEYKDIAPLERTKLCDTVTVEFEKLGVSTKAKVIKTVYDTLLERYEGIEIGESRSNLADTFINQGNEIKESTNLRLEKEISHATRLIQGGLGGHVVTNVNEAGEPNEILIMDTDSIETAKNVLRINMNGIGFSSNGYNGPFRSAWTLDGHFVADFIDTGTLSADLVKTGILSDITGNVTWNMATGAIAARRLSIDSPYFKLTEDGHVTARHITATGGTIGGAAILENALKASNGKWAINSDGTTQFQDVKITGVQAGSTFGSIGYGANGVTYGSFGGASYFSPTAANPFGGQAVTQIESLAVNKVYAQYIQGMQADISTIKSDYITTGELYAVSERVGSLEADHVTAAQVDAINGKFNNLNANNITVGTISTDRLDIDSIVSRMGIATSWQIAGYLGVNGDFTYNHTSVKWGTINGIKCLVADE